MLSVIIPKNGEKVYRIAGEVFRDMYEKVTGITLPVVTEPADGDMVIIGSDSVNDTSAELFLDGCIDSYNICYGKDNYRIISVKKDGKNLPKKEISPTFASANKGITPKSCLWRDSSAG